MNGGGCQNCQNSPWVQRANAFINQQNPPEQIETVRFLLQNGHCGINNRTNIDAILNHLKKVLGSTLNREDFQNDILTELKKRGIVATLIYPGPQGGVFIPCDDSEIRKVALQVLNRIIQELRNLEGIATQTQIENTISVLRELIELLRVLVK
jgi:hypothetical protein